MGYLSLLVGSTALALLAAGLLRQRESLLGYVGAGAIANLLASWVRSWLEIAPWRAIGLLDPILWIFGACLVVFLVRGRLAVFVARLRVRWALPSGECPDDSQGRPA